MAEKRPPQPKRTTKSAESPKTTGAAESAPESRDEAPALEPPKGKHRSKKWIRSLGPRARAYAERTDVPPPPSAEAPTVEKVEYIAAEMAAGRWDGYVSRAPLVRAWAVGDSRVQQLATEAHRLVAYDKESREQKRTALAAFIGGIRRDASTKINDVTGLPDYVAALKAAELEAKFVGITFEDEQRPDVVAMRIVVEDAKDEAAASDAPSETP